MIDDAQPQRRGVRDDGQRIVRPLPVEAQHPSEQLRVAPIPEGSVLLCVDDAVASVVAQTCEEACDRECCISSRAYDGSTVGVCWDSTRCSTRCAGEGGYRDACIDGVFLGCECTRGSRIKVYLACFIGFSSHFVMVLLCWFFV